MVREHKIDLLSDLYVSAVSAGGFTLSGDGIYRTRLYMTEQDLDDVEGLSEATCAEGSKHIDLDPAWLSASCNPSVQRY